MANKHKRYYAVTNINWDKPYYIVTGTKKRMIDTLNILASKLFSASGHFYPYRHDALSEDARVYDGVTLLTHYISDDWADVTPIKSEFQKDLDRAKLITGRKPVKFEL